MYNYLESMKSDVRDYIAENINLSEYREDRERLEWSLHDDLWIVDSVTGNASGSYFCNSYKSMECVLDNMDILNDMCCEFCVSDEEIGSHFKNEDWEWMDVSIRCYLLGQAISEVLDEADEAGAFDPIEESEAEQDEIIAAIA